MRHFILFKSADGLEKKERVTFKPTRPQIDRVAFPSFQYGAFNGEISVCPKIQRRIYRFYDQYVISHKRYVDLITVYGENL